MIPALAERLPSLRCRYAEPHRVYHGQPHVDAMLLGLSETDRAHAALDIAARGNLRRALGQMMTPAAHTP